MCFDLGRPDFDKHNVRDSARNTTCPYLLNTKCKNCGYFGHTSSYCKMPSHLNPVFQKPVVKHIKIVKSIPKPSNAFDLLQCLEIEDNLEVEKDNIEHQLLDEDTDDELPDLSKIQWGKGFSKKSWADEVEKQEKKSPTWAEVLVC